MRPLKYWNGPRVEAEGGAVKKRVRRIPARAQQKATRQTPLLPRAVGLRRFWRWPGVLAWWPRSCGYGAALRVVASAKNRQHAVPDSSI